MFCLKYRYRLKVKPSYIRILASGSLLGKSCTYNEETRLCLVIDYSHMFNHRHAVHPYTQFSTCLTTRSKVRNHDGCIDGEIRKLRNGFDRKRRKVGFDFTNKCTDIKVWSLRSNLISNLGSQGFYKMSLKVHKASHRCNH